MTSELGFKLLRGALAAFCAGVGWWEYRKGRKQEATYWMVWAVFCAV